MLNAGWAGQMDEDSGRSKRRKEEKKEKRKTKVDEMAPSLNQKPCANKLETH
jgi:hypothetical protein